MVNELDHQEVRIWDLRQLRLECRDEVLALPPTLFDSNNIEKKIGAGVVWCGVGTFWRCWNGSSGQALRRSHQADRREPMRLRLGWDRNCEAYGITSLEREDEGDRDDGLLAS